MKKFLLITCFPALFSILPSAQNSFAQTAECPGTGYCETGLHFYGCDVYLGSPSFPIGEVKFAGIDNVQTVACDAIPPTDAHCGSGVANVKSGETYDMMIDVGDNNGTANLGNFYGVWIDFNQDGMFTEEEFVASNPVETTTPFYTKVRISNTALPGKTRMRIRSDWYDNHIEATEACKQFTYGETEDYEINIEACPASALITAEGDTFLCLGDSVKLTASEGIAYLWNTGETTQSVYAKEAMTYEVTVTNPNGCKALDSIPVMVVECPPTGISTSFEAEVAVWPNPTTGIVNIVCELPKGIVNSLEVLNIYGQLLKTETLNTHQLQQLDLSHQPAGIYYIRLNGKDFSLMRRVALQ